MTISAWLQSLRGKRVAVLGYGISNRPLVTLLLSAGLNVCVRDRSVPGDLPDCETRFGADYLAELSEDVIFRSPGIRPDLPEIADALSRGALLTSEMEVFFRLCPCPVIGVTGSDGKTTTASLIAALLEADGKTVHLGGNIGTPLLDKVPLIAPEDYAVVELSSFQLMTFTESPHIAVLTNITPNHLDWHKNFDEYASAKTNIFRFQKPGDRLVFDANSVAGVPLKHVLGEHNRRHFATAVEALGGIISREAIARVAENFPGVPHRLEFIREVKGVKYYNDSIASSPDRTIAGLEAFGQRVILIAGGKDKGIPYDALGPALREKVKLLVLNGPTSEKIVTAAGTSVPNKRCGDLAEAVRAASEAAEAGDIVLLSPASTSFDQFRNFEERGEKFRELVSILEN
ncbi:MAG: UDP-N-acetylmuramoyl-L-alanine--D-glutamate ligase [Oscillospiraceae bacterium]|nr:UDP-N-acetylmuramoyl-L-alanine--D-glutamate ligase [Oscillospiraceae bacterium]